MAFEMQGKLGDVREIVIVGGGFAGLEAAITLHAELGEGAQVTLISDQRAFLFRPYLTYVPFGLVPERLKIDLVALAEARGIHFQQGRVEALHPEEKRIKVGEELLDYDFLMLATGARAEADAVPGLQAYGFTLWREADLEQIRYAFDALLRHPNGGAPRRVLFAIPPGSQWAGPLYELAFMLERWLHWKEARQNVEIIFALPDEHHMPLLGPPIHEALAGEFDRGHIVVRAGARLEEVEEKAAVLAGGERLAFDLLIASPVYRASADWSPLSTDAHGFLHTVPETRQALGQPAIYALGDGSSYPVKQAFVALLQADAAVEHLVARLQQREPAFSFDPSSLWLMEQFDQALLAHTTSSDKDEAHLEALPVGQLRRMAIRQHLPWRLDLGNPLYAGLLWKGTEVGLQVLRQLTAQEE